MKYIFIALVMMDTGQYRNNSTTPLASGGGNGKSEAVTFILQCRAYSTTG